MSRREPRVSITVRQNDALFEFENFKKKFLLANKHITKLNSTLSVRIEELNAQISTLYVENLRLRASEIALEAQLKREREKSRKVLAEAESATANLTKHFNFLRQSFKVPLGYTSPPQPQPPRAQRPVPNSTASPPVPRLSRAPNIPGIYEDDEAVNSPEAEFDEDLERERDDSPSPTVRRKSKARLSASRLPLPSRVSPPLILSPLQGELHNGQTKTRKTSRRQSGLLSVNRVSTDLPPRPPSPAFGSPIRREAGLAEEEDERAIVEEEVEVEIELEIDTIMGKDKREKRGKARDRERDVEREPAVENVKSRKKRTREGNEVSNSTDGNKPSLQDVTNSPRSHTDLPPLETNTSERDRYRTPEADPPTSAVSTITSSSLAATRSLLSTPATTPAMTPIMQTSHLPTPRSSSSPVPPPTSASESDAPANTNGRESRRTRKSVNYAEPKLNTKMRKPDPASGTVTKKRSSTTPLNDDPGTRSSLEVPTPATIQLTSNIVSSSSRPAASSVTTVKRKKSRPYILPEEGDESEGAQADAEYNGLGRGHSWVNVDGRRRSTQTTAATAPSATNRRVELDDGRRHSMAI